MTYFILALFALAALGFWIGTVRKESRTQWMNAIFLSMGALSAIVDVLKVFDWTLFLTERRAAVATLFSLIMGVIMRQITDAPLRKT